MLLRQPRLARISYYQLWRTPSTNSFSSPSFLTHPRGARPYNKSVRYGYVKSFEQPDNILPNTYIVVRIDGRGFHKFTTRHAFQKPNDLRALHLMNAAALAVVRDIPDITIAYGVSDEYSFVFRRGTTLFDRRSSKLLSTVVSHFTAHYIYQWREFFGAATELGFPLPTFDGRCVTYPSVENVRDYMSWRQVDAHINNLYNTTFWTLVLKGGRTEQEAERKLSGTLASDKNEILFSQFGINYNNEPEICKKGSVIFKEYEDTSPSTLETAAKEAPSIPLNEKAQRKQDILQVRSEVKAKAAPRELSKSQLEKIKKRERKAKVVVKHMDIIGDKFWEERPWILDS